MAIIDRDAREAMIQVLHHAIEHAQEVNLEEQTVGSPTGTVLVLQHRGQSFADDGRQTLYTLSLTMVADTETLIDTILERGRRWAPKQ
jgi:hypothetical protein